MQTNPPTIAQLLDLIQQWAEQPAGSPFLLQPALTALHGEERLTLWRLIRDRISQLPTPLPLPVRLSSRKPVNVRARLERAAAELSALGGQYQELISILEKEWMKGGPVIPLLELYLLAGRSVELGAMGRLAMSRVKDPHERAIIASLLEKSGRAPAGWHEALQAFSMHPSLPSWGALVRRLHLEHSRSAKHSALLALKKLGVNMNLLFVIASHEGFTPDAARWAEEGHVAPEVIAKRSRETYVNGGFWLGLAAKAAWARGDRFQTVRFLNEAFMLDDELSLAETSSRAIRETADEELHELMDKAGLPRFGSESSTQPA